MNPRGVPSALLICALAFVAQPSRASEFKIKEFTLTGIIVGLGAARAALVDDTGRSWQTGVGSELCGLKIASIEGDSLVVHPVAYPNATTTVAVGAKLPCEHLKQ